MIKAPGWCAHAVPTTRGWKHHRTSEILKKRSISQAEIDEWHAAHGGQTAPTPAPAPVTAPTPAPAAAVVQDGEHDLESMSKEELEILGREYGVELDRRRAKFQLVNTMRRVIDSK
jgi:hypothetical protein